MPMNQIIREKRKALGLTQEQIADYLGVSTPAVNKWEKGSTYPDISLLPALARLLLIDLNTLLCFHEGLSEQEINNFTKEVIDTMNQSGYEKGFSMAMEKIREYPNCDMLIHTTALLLEGAILLYGADMEDKEIYRNQITTLYERAAKSQDDKIRNGSIYMLVSKYTIAKDYDKANELLELLPERTALDKKELKANLYMQQGQYTEAFDLYERKLYMAVQEVQTGLLHLLDLELKEENMQNASHLAKLSKQLAKMFELWELSSFIAPLEVALANKEAEESIALLKSMFSATLTPWEFSKTTLFRHILFKETADLKNKKGKPVSFGKKVMPSLLSEVEQDPKYAFLQSNKEFQQLVKQYRNL